MGPKAPGYAQLTGMKVTATAIYYRDLTLMAQIATLLGNTQDYRVVTSCRNCSRELQPRTRHSDTNQYDTGSQTANAISLALGLVPEERRHAVLDNLVADVRSHQNDLTAGDIGFHYVLEALN